MTLQEKMNKEVDQLESVDSQLTAIAGQKSQLEKAQAQLILRKERISGAINMLAGIIAEVPEQIEAALEEVIDDDE